MIKDRGKSYRQQVVETLVVMAILMSGFALIAHSSLMCR